ncbi:MAG: excisionase family DNA-binding protein [Brachybacterium sp.]|uniref:helix-turn-helix domain-containing protein n=1 Tax=Brachybacterium sp. TaxID=1891286 RepID=UPI002647E5B6|nr:helix-turn-helix domain-containing protein [Brachybacterium sp.]MDN5688816.1 excisionase family DNA-binding protein [Brachybacterium sp.]
METITTTTVPSAQIDELEQLIESAPVELREILQALASSLRDGNEVVAFDADDTITPTHAAKRLRMSRTHLYKLLDDGAIPSHRVGRDRRILVRDLAAFAMRRDAERRELAERFAAREKIEDSAARELAELL